MGGAAQAQTTAEKGEGRGGAGGGRRGFQENLDPTKKERLSYSRVMTEEKLDTASIAGSEFMVLPRRKKKEKEKKSYQ